MNFLKAALAIGLLALASPKSLRLSDEIERYWAESTRASEIDLIECTTGIASSVATPDGRPLLWKNRDLGGGNDQEFHYFSDGRIPFISVTYSGETDEYYGGVNAEGFAVENSNSYNLPLGPAVNGFSSGDDDGFIHTLALATCRTIDDFAALLDSTNVDGRTLTCNYGAIDAYGGAAIFETAGYDYTRFDAADAPGGFLVRSNYSYTGDNLDSRPLDFGPHRHDAAFELFRRAVERGELTPLYVFQHIVRDLSAAGLDPYPLPFDGYYLDNPYGSIPNSDAICRSTTRSALVVHGVANGQRPEDATLWAMVGSQLTTVALPLWVRAGSVPLELNGPNGSRICSRGNQLLSYAYSRASSVDTWHLTNPERTGIWDCTLPLEQWVFAKTERFLSSPGFDYDRLQNFQNEIALQVADSLDAWHTPIKLTEIFVYRNWRNDIILHWGAPDNGERISPQRYYRVYRSTSPFRENDRGELIATVSDPGFIDSNPPSPVFYQVDTVH